jgi:hypothetical protein
MAVQRPGGRRGGRGDRIRGRGAMSGHSERRGEPARRASDEWRGWRAGWPFEATGVSAPERVNVHGVFTLVVHLVLKRKAVCAAVTAAVQSVWSDLLPQANKELVESGLSGEPVRKSRLAGQPGVTE